MCSACCERCDEPYVPGGRHGFESKIKQMRAELEKLKVVKLIRRPNILAVESKLLKEPALVPKSLRDACSAANDWLARSEALHTPCSCCEVPCLLGVETLTLWHTLEESLQLVISPRENAVNGIEGELLLRRVAQALRPQKPKFVDVRALWNLYGRCVFSLDIYIYLLQSTEYMN